MEITDHKNVRRYRSGKITVYRIPLHCFAGHFTNVYLVLGKHPFLIDTGTDNRKSRRIFDEGFLTIRERFHEDIAFKDVPAILISHGHVDHFGMLGNEGFVEKTVYVHETESAYLKNYLPTIADNSIAIANFLKTTGISDALREGMMAIWNADFQSLKPRPITQPIIDIRDGDQIIDGYTVHHTPGHAPGAICLEVGDFLFVGDTILDDITPHQSPAVLKKGRGLAVYLNSLAAIEHLCCKKDFYALPAHGDDVYPVSKRVNELKKFHKERLEKIERICSEVKTVYEVTTEYFNESLPAIFARPDLPDINKLLAILEISAHMEFLLAENRLTKANDPSEVARYLCTGIR